MTSLYLLCEYDIPVSTVQRIKAEGITFEEILIKREEVLKKVWTSRSEMMEKVIEAADIIAENKINHTSVYELTCYDISHNICDRLFRRGATLEKIEDLNYWYFENIYDCKTAMADKIKKAIKDYKFNNAYKEEKDLDFSEYLLSIMKEVTYEEAMSYISLRIYLSENTNYPTQNLSKDIERLRARNLIELKSEGFKYKVPTLEEAINEYLKDNYIDIFRERLEGKTLEEIGQSRGITRERVRQISSKCISELPDVKENKYKALFEKYNWTEETFCAFINEPKMVYYYFKEFTKTGDTDISELYNSDITEEQIEVIDSYNNYTCIDGRKVKSNKKNLKMETIRIALSKYATKPIKIDELRDIYNKLIKTDFKDYNIEEMYERGFSGMLERSRCALLSLGRNVRYYDFDSLGETELKKLKQLLEIDNGYYSTSLLFDNNLELMKELDVLNEYELHNLLKSLFGKDLENIIFTRMPGFLVGYKTGEEFLFDKAKELSPISIKDFTNILNDDYGHKGFMFAVLSDLFKDYIINGIIQLEQFKLEPDELEMLKSIFKKDVYGISDVKEILNSNNISLDAINNFNINSIGYRLKSNYIIKDEISSVDEYAKKLIEISNFIDANIPCFKPSAFYSPLLKYERNYDIIKISEDRYITSKKLNELGITKKYLLDLIDNIKTNFKDIFTLENIKDKLDIELMENFGFEDIFYESILNNIPNINSFRFARKKIYSFNSEKVTSLDFLESIINELGNVTLDRLIMHLFNDYNIEIDIYKLKSYISNLNFYYNDILEKIYIDKNDYYEEVYSYE